MEAQGGPEIRENRLQPRWFSAATILALITIVVSLSVAYLVNGTFLTSVPIADLRAYGGTTVEDIRNLELWRLAVAQMLHAKMPHMLYNALALFFLGSLLERVLGPLRLLLLWLVAGGIATVFSPVFVEAPWNVGTGASQATFAFSGCATVLAMAHALSRKWAIPLVVLAVVPGLLLDLVFGGYPKPGHITGFVLGAGYGTLHLWLRRPIRTRRARSPGAAEEE